MIYDCLLGEEEVINNQNINISSAYLKLKQLLDQRKTVTVNLLPYAENAVVDIRKLRDYCLNPNHDEGKHKARLFSSMLGLTAENAEDLRQIILAAVKTQEAKLNRNDDFGQRYTVEFTLKWQNRSATVRSGWIIEHGSTTPRLTTCYPL
ncbi:MAG TPA: hypothetical protein VK203_09835 [Nostocaceae cyanobacterium]|nr:hypothetical protein [Nostocaceae cyanobacterium]